VSSALALLLVSQAGAEESVVGGVDHVGLTVTDLAATETFFVETLGFKVLRRDPEYPASFLTNGHIIITLWRAIAPETAVPFNRKNNVGLHHMAFKVGGFLGASPACPPNSYFPLQM